MCIECRVNKATDTHPEYAIFIAFPLQQYLHERASVLHHKYIACFLSDKLNYATNHLAVEDLATLQRKQR